MSIAVLSLALSATLAAGTAEDHDLCAQIGPEMFGRGEARLEESVGIPASEALRDGCVDVAVQLASTGKPLRVAVCRGAVEKLGSLARQAVRAAEFAPGEAEAIALPLCVKRVD